MWRINIIHFVLPSDMKNHRSLECFFPRVQFSIKYANFIKGSVNDFYYDIKIPTSVVFRRTNDLPHYISST